MKTQQKQIGKNNRQVILVAKGIRFGEDLQSSYESGSRKASQSLTTAKGQLEILTGVALPKISTVASTFSVINEIASEDSTSSKSVGSFGTPEGQIISKQKTTNYQPSSFVSTSNYASRDNQNVLDKILNSFRRFLNND